MQSRDSEAVILQLTSVYTVSCVDWMGNFINFEPTKFGYYLVNFFEFKIPNHSACRHIYTG